MIIIKYFGKEILKNQIVIILILFAIFFFQKFIKIINSVASEGIPKNLIINLLILGLPEIAQLILPLSLFLSILMTFRKLYISNEITAIYACGFKKRILLTVVIYVALITMIMAMINVSWLMPLSSYYFDKTKKYIQHDLNSLILAAGQFHIINNGNTVIFVENVQKNRFHNIFLAQLSYIDNIPEYIIVGHYGKLEHYLNESKIISIKQGFIFEKSKKTNNFKITNFDDYQSIIYNNKTIISNIKNAKHVNFIDLWTHHTPVFRAELNWRIISIISVILMAMIAVPLSFFKKSHQGIIFSIMLYLIFFLIQNALKFKVSQGNIDSLIWMWSINFIYLILAIMLNIWNNLNINKSYLLFKF